MKKRILPLSANWIIITLLLGFFSLLSGKENLSAVVKSNNVFGLQLYQQVLKQNAGNLFLSPYSISSTLSMIYAGANGATKEELEKVLHFSITNLSLHSAWGKWQTELNGLSKNGNVQIQVANGLWLQTGYQFQKRFLGLVKKYYGAGLNNVDFAKKRKAARLAINKWVANKTRQKIRNLLKPGMLKPLTRLFLVNAIYFKGQWLHPFEVNSTQESEFHLSKNQVVEVPMMHQTDQFKIKDFEDFSVIELPYRAEAISMFIFLPRETEGLGKLEKRFSYENVQKWISQLTSTQKRSVILSLPRFKIYSGIDLLEPLMNLGIKHVFNNGDFTGISSQCNLNSGQIIHASYLEVNEKGTEATAVTFVGSVTGGGMLPLPPAFIVDHPFIFLICENKRGGILFIGRITNPVQ